MTHRPTLGITMGDPAGVGPEIILKALSDTEIFDFCRPLIIGDPGAFSAPDGTPGSPNIREISSIAESSGQPGTLELIAVTHLDPRLITPGRPSVEGGKSMVESIIRAVDLVKKGSLDGVVTCPINKHLMHQAGFKYDGHTQLLAHLTDCKEVVMMLAGDKLRVALVTIHCALKDVPCAIDMEAILRTLSITSDAMRRDFGIQNPRLAVAALNPHAGEEGLFGSEEELVISPAIKTAVEKGINAQGPFPADTLFYKAVSGQFDAVVCMYHDQGLIPLKLLHFSDGVNITLGLPIVRTSVDHGTAYDIAGKGIADASSLKAAIRTAADMARNRALKE